MTPEEIAALSAVCHADDAWSADAVRRQLALTTSRLLTRGDKAAMLVTFIAPEAEILLLDVHPDLRRRGHARDMLLQLKTEAEVIHLDVAADNTPARRLYESEGFQETGRRRGYYFRLDGPRQDALTMTWRATATERP